jgi:hypothetical protein
VGREFGDRIARFKRSTHYQLVEMAGTTVLRASADASASGLLHAVTVDPRRHRWLRWRWRVDNLIAAADNTQRRREDSPVRLVIMFDGDRSKLPFAEKMTAAELKLATGQELPYATLMYIWENRLPRETVIENPHTSRVRMFVAESGPERVGTWWDETRNVYEDYRKAFGEEPGNITAIAVLTDTDNTESLAEAYYGDIEFVAEAGK